MSVHIAWVRGTVDCAENKTLPLWVEDKTMRAVP